MPNDPAHHIVNRLAARGCSLDVRADGRLSVAPRRMLTDDDRRDLRNHRDAIVRILAADPEGMAGFTEASPGFWVANIHLGGAAKIRAMLGDTR